MSLNTSRIDELRGSMLTVLAPSFVSVLTNAYYGGQIKHLNINRTEFTATEERIIEIINSGLNETLEASWRDLMAISVQYSSREVNPQFASFVDGGDLVIICSFVVQLPNIDAASFDIIYPLQTLKPIAALLRSRVQTDKANDDQTWRERMERAVLEIPLSMTARLSQPTVSMNKLIHLRKGDVFPINIGEGVEMLIEKRPFYSGELGEVGGQAAISLTQRITE